MGGREKGGEGMIWQPKYYKDDSIVLFIIWGWNGMEGAKGGSGMGQGMG